MSPRPMCPHGYLKESLCITCTEVRADAAETDRDAWKARAEKAETRAYDAEAHADLFRESMVAAERRAEEAEAQLQAAVDAFARACRSENGVQSAIEILGRDRDVWKARDIKHGRQVDELVTQVCRLVEREEANIERAAQAEAQAAAMLQIIRKHIHRSRSLQNDVTPYVDAGRTLLAEVEALREVAEVARVACCDRDGDPTQQMLDAFARLDAARSGGAE